MEHLLKYCNTDHQREIIKLYMKGLSGADIARKKGVKSTNINRAIRKIKERAANAEEIPAWELEGKTAENLSLDGASHLKRLSNGELVWLKYKKGQREQEAAIVDYIDNITSEIPARPEIKSYQPGSSELANLYTFTDYHIGMLAWHEEGGADWDISIAKDTLKAAFHDMYNRAPKADTAIINQLGDFLHYDSMQPTTPTSGHIVDADSRPAKMIETALDCLDFLVSEALKTHKNVKLVIATGNHDLYGSLWVQAMFKRLYCDNARVEIIARPVPFYALKWGRNLLGFHHGHKVKFDKLPALFMDEFREIVGDTVRSYLHMGHYHHKHIKELGKTTVEMHRTLAARDSHASHGGYHSERATDLITYHTHHGEIGRLTVYPRKPGEKLL